MPLNDVKKQPLPKRHSCLGTIRLGVKVPTSSGRERPQATGYYVFKDAPKLAGHFGDEKVTALPIRFPFGTFD